MVELPTVAGWPVPLRWNRQPCSLYPVQSLTLDVGIVLDLASSVSGGLGLRELVDEEELELGEENKVLARGSYDKNY